MAWELAIDQVGLRGSGDATIITATNGAIRRCALIDGGRKNDVDDVKRRVAFYAQNSLDVLVATHYDEDHLGGLRGLLALGEDRLQRTAIFDQGEPGTRAVIRNFRAVFEGNDISYINYAQLCQKENRDRVTAKVLCGEQPLTPNLCDMAYRESDWLVGQEILWYGYSGAQRPAGYPTLTCIAANEWLLQGDGSKRYQPSSTLAGDPRNPRSLAFLLAFGGFKYYLGGDIEAMQEDGSVWAPGSNNYMYNFGKGQYALQNYLNPTNNQAGRVHAAKLSHHGSKYSSSPHFIRWLRPRAAFISCGPDNSYGHPDQVVVDTLEGQSVDYFLTGEDLRRGSTDLGAHAYVAGVFPPDNPQRLVSGSIRIVVQQPPAFTVRCMYPNAGTNIEKSVDFDYRPYTLQSFAYA